MRIIVSYNTNILMWLLMINQDELTAVILSGGRSSRLQGKDKGLILLNDKPLIAHVVDVVKHQVGTVLISANRNIQAYRQFGEVVEDDMLDFQGPLAGIASALKIAKTPYLLIWPCDAPYIHKITIDRLIDAMDNNDNDICVAYDGLRIHPTMALIKVSLQDNLLDFLMTGERKLGLWIKGNDFIKVDLSDELKIFVNLNSPEDFRTQV